MLAKTSPNGRTVYKFEWASNSEFHEYRDAWLLSEAIGTALCEMQARIAKRHAIEPYVVLGDNE